MSHSILIVDDQREVIRLLESALASIGQRFVITGVLSGEEALLEARLNHVDLLIADIRLPGMSGLELYTRIRVLQPQVKTILMTGVQDPKTRASAANAGADGFFIKPIEIADFLASVEQILDLTVSAPVAPPEIEQEPAPEKGISDRLAQFRRDLEADTVFLLNDSGEVLVRAGSLADTELEDLVLPALMSASSAGLKVSQLIGRSRTDNLYFFDGERYDLVMAPVGTAYSLVAVVPRSNAGRTTAAIHLGFERARMDVSAILANLGIPLSVDEPLPIPPFLTPVEDAFEPEPETTDDALESLLSGRVPEEIRAEADVFWEPEEESTGAGEISADALSYEQALRLGLAPEDDVR
ncbi:MAG TPA: response regulator [Anaerolineales bacterium]|nr:response regulator [Anaerolineales bacterium]